MIFFIVIWQIISWHLLSKLDSSICAARLHSIHIIFAVFSKISHRIARIGGLIFYIFYFLNQISRYMSRLQILSISPIFNIFSSKSDRMISVGGLILCSCLKSNPETLNQPFEGPMNRKTSRRKGVTKLILHLIVCQARRMENGAIYLEPNLVDVYQNNKSSVNIVRQWSLFRKDHLYAYFLRNKSE